MPGYKTSSAVFGLGLILAAAGAIAAEGQPQPNATSRGGNPALECNKAELEAAAKSGKKAEDCNAEKVRKAGGNQEIQQPVGTSKPGGAAGAVKHDISVKPGTAPARF
jgi:hypothetical protein